MHTPQDEESKRLPFEEAASGAVALETLLPAALRLFHAGDLELPQLFRALSYNPAKRLGLAAGRMAAGAPADLLLFDAHAPFVMNRFTLLSKSKNTPFDEAKMQGRVLATYVAGEPVYEGFCMTPIETPILILGPLGCCGVWDGLCAFWHRALAPDGSGRFAQAGVGQYRRHQCAAHRQ